MVKKAAAPKKKAASKKKAVKKAAVKTQKTNASVAAFIDAVDDETRRKDAKAMDKMFREITGEKPAMWGPSIIGYGAWEYTNTLGTASWPKAGFSPRSAALTLYVLPYSDKDSSLLKKLGKHKTGKSCLYIGKLADVDQKVLREIATLSWKRMTEKYG